MAGPRSCCLRLQTRIRLNVKASTTKVSCYLPVSSCRNFGSDTKGHLNGDQKVYFNYSSDSFIGRHIGPSEKDKSEMLQKIGYNSVDDLINDTIPADIRFNEQLSLSQPLSESQLLNRLETLANKNQHTWRSFIGMGYNNCITPPVILRNVLENPGERWLLMRLLEPTDALPPHRMDDTIHSISGGNRSGSS